MNSKTKKRKKLIVPLKKNAGRSNQGKITVRHRGGGAKRLYRVVSFGQEPLGVEGKVVSVEYDPNRTANIALVEYDNKEVRYILAPQKLKEGDKVITDEKTEVKPGNRMQLKNIPVGTAVYNIAIHPDARGKLVRSAGAGALILAHEGNTTHIKMPSREVRKVVNKCFASIGEVGNSEHRYKKIGKAGTSRKMGRRPVVRGSAMNPVDHPHGGGEGKAPIGMPAPKTPWGKIARGVKTRKRKHTDKYIIKRAAKKRKGKK
jgi:large subunit ribosomal protein L2